MNSPQHHLNAARMRADRRRAWRDAAIIAGQLALLTLACLTIATQPF